MARDTLDNKLIAEFMKGEIIKVKFAGAFYHNSWDWLMPVVEKIRSMGYKITIEADMYVTASTNWAVIYKITNDAPQGFPRLTCYSKNDKSLLEVTYNVIVEFIKTEINELIQG